MVKNAINTCEDGTARTITWYAKGGRSNFAAWSGPDRFLMTAILEEYDEEELKETNKENMKIEDRFIVDHQGYGKADPRPGSHLVPSASKDVCTTLTTFCGMNKLVVEVYDEDSEGLWK